jgi:hypothetical protein
MDGPKVAAGPVWPQAARTRRAMTLNCLQPVYDASKFQRFCLCFLCNACLLRIRKTSFRTVLCAVFYLLIYPLQRLSDFTGFTYCSNFMTSFVM